MPLVRDDMPGFMDYDPDDRITPEDYGYGRDDPFDYEELPGAQEETCTECGGDGYVVESEHDDRCKAQWGGPCDGPCPVPIQAPCPVCR